MALAYSGIIIDLREISLKNRPKSLYAVSQKGTVPVLCINDDNIIDESLEIMLWSLKHNDHGGWMKQDIKLQLEIIKFNDTTFKYWLDRYKYFDRYLENDKEYYRNKCNDFLLQINSFLIKNKFMLSDCLSLVDIAIFPFIRQFFNVDKNWLIDEYPVIYKWIDDLLQSKLFLSVMNKYEENKGESLIVNFNCK